MQITRTALCLVFLSSALAVAADTKPLAGRKVAILVADGFEQSELALPRKALEDAGATAVIVSPETSNVRGWKNGDWGDDFRVEVRLDDANPDKYDALLLPGGVMNPDKLRTNPKAVEFVKRFVASGKPVGAICHGPWILIEADVVRGRRLTSWASLKTDIKNAGGVWENSAVVVDKGLVTSRMPDDIPAFNKQIIAVFSGDPAKVAK